MITEQSSQAQIDALGERMERNFSEIKEMLLRFDERLRQTERLEASCQPLINSRLDAAFRKIDIHDVELDKLRAALSQLTKITGQLESVSRWLLGIATAIIVAVLIAFLTGKIDIVLR